MKKTGYIDKSGKLIEKPIYADKWGKIIEITRYRDTRPGKRGRFVKASSVKKFKRWLPKREVELYREVGGKRSTPIKIERPSTIIKSTYPGSPEDYDGNIFEMLEDTNLFTAIHSFSTAFVNIRGWIGTQEIKIQGEFELGEHNQAEQLTMYVKELLASYNMRTQYDLKVIKMSSKSRRAASQLDEVEDMTITVTLKK
jgi:hypothetical protein